MTHRTTVATIAPAISVVTRTIIMPFVLVVSIVTIITRATGSLDIYFIDVEGGQSTLIVTPARQSLLIDTGYPGLNGRDPDRIMAAARQAGITRIDYLVITHFTRTTSAAPPDSRAEFPSGRSSTTAHPFRRYRMSLRRSPRTSRCAGKGGIWYPNRANGCLSKGSTSLW